MLLYNGQLLPEQEFKLPLTNRAFQYNDGFFETMIVQQGRISFWNDHVDRMQEAAAALQLEFMPGISPEDLKAQILQLANQNGVTFYGRIKVKVWRGGAGLYTPQTNAVEWLATANSTAKSSESPLHIGVCRNISTLPSPLSFFKGPNALVYVMAGAEKEARQLNDMLLLSPKGEVAELISANIFWLQNGILHTPALSTGCVNGILRRNILRWCAARHIEYKEGSYTITSLQNAQGVFAANVTGIRSIASIEGTAVASLPEFVADLKQSIGV
jgi:branched-chain amino acid aminotransferase/4-amino-4-deoxychorismate lyase